MLFLSTLTMGTLISISAYSWLSMWMGLEVNLLSFIPLINSKYPHSSEASLKYFIIQSMSSMIILFSVSMSLLMNELTNLTEYLTLMFSTALLTKMGAAPFHFWFIEIVEGMSWMNTLILMTWQKIAPFILLMYNLTFNSFFFFIIIISMMISSIKSWNTTSLKKILTFSSINHMGWMLSTLFFNQTLWIYYFFTYSFMTFSLIVYFKKFKMKSFTQIFSSIELNKTLKMFFFFNLFSMGGLPPFLGFFPKWIVANSLISNNFHTLAFMMMMATTMMLYIYIRLMFQSLPLKSFKLSHFNQMNNKFMINMINFINLSGLIIQTLIFNLI